MTEAAVDVVIPTWNRRDLLVRCLEHLRGQTVPVHVIVVDNASEDGTVEAVCSRFPEVRLVELHENLGFGSAINRGVSAGEADTIVLVNNDVECDPTFVERIAAPLGAERVGMVAGLLLRPGRSVIDSYGLELDRTLAAFPRFAGEPYRRAALHDRHLAGPSGGAAAYRRTAYEDVGGFDERLFAYMEDVDLALTFRARGWLCAGAPDAIGVHLGSASFGRRSRGQVEQLGTSRGYMLRKYGVLRGGPRRAAAALVTEVVAAGVETVLGRDLAAIRGRIRGWRQASRLEESIPADAINDRIGVVGALRRRRAGL